MQPLIGCDPEVFLKHKDSLVSAAGLIPGTKAQPYYVNRGTVQVDGMAAEIGIEPAATKAEFVMSVNEVLFQLSGMIPEHQIVIDAVAKFDPSYMKQVPDECKALGCNPDYDAYEECTNPAPDQHPTMRTAAGHIHLGWTNDRDPMSIEHFMQNCALAKQCDYVLGIPSVLMDPDTERKVMYGKAGAFRPKPYGTEYRVLSNFWLKSDELMGWAFDGAERAFHMLFNEGRFLYKEFGDTARNIINSNDKAAAKEWCDKLELKVA